MVRSRADTMKSSRADIRSMKGCTGCLADHRNSLEIAPSRSPGSPAPPTSTRPTRRGARSSPPSWSPSRQRPTASTSIRRGDAPLKIAGGAAASSSKRMPPRREWCGIPGPKRQPPWSISATLRGAAWSASRPGNVADHEVRLAADGEHQMSTVISADAGP